MEKPRLREPMTTISTIIPLEEIKNNRLTDTQPNGNHVLRGSTLSFRGIKYVLNGSLGDHRRRELCPSCLKAPPSKRILNNVSGIFTPGMNAIMGPTGCGKSSLLDVLAYRKDMRDVKGEIFIDGLLIPSSYKYMIGYVVQEDIISGTLTVRENLMFSANVRLSSDIKLNERKDRVERVIKELGLISCANTRIGTEFLRGVSGGERKRTCIGMELVLEPKLLFLDEPTTGLDASTARNVMACLSHLSKSGRTIIFSIHQPRYSIFKLFDRVLLMSNGHCIYQGSSINILNYFSKQGYQCEVHDNPADFVLDILIDTNQNENQLKKLSETYKTSLMYSKVNEDIEKQRQRILPIEDNKSLTKRLRTRQFYYVSKRTITNVVRNPELFFSQIIVSIILGLLTGLVFYQMENTTNPGIANRLGAIFFIITSQIFSTVTALESLIKERVLFIHETVSGYYRISTFFFTKLICDLLPMRVLPSILYSILSYYLTGLQESSGQFFIFFLTIFMSNIFGSALCFLISATIPVFAVALIVVVLIFVIMMIFSGFIVDLSSIFSWLSWIQWISAFRYGSNMLTINEFSNMTFCLANQTNICPMNGTTVLEDKNIDYKTNWDMWKNFLALSIITLSLLILAFIQLLRMKKTK